MYMNDTKRCTSKSRYHKFQTIPPSLGGYSIVRVLVNQTFDVTTYVSPK